MEWVLDFRAAWLTPIMQVATALGDEPFFLAALPIGYWLWRRDGFARVGVLFLLCVVLNAALKEVFQAPRPMLVPLTEAHGFSFPSGHAQISAAFWGALALEVGRRWFTIAAVCLVLLVMSSRVYLGVHWPHDVLVGAIIGLTLVGASVVFRRMEGGRRLVEMGRWVAWAPVLLVVGLAVLLGDPEDTALKSAATLAGFWGGVLLSDRSAVPEIPGGLIGRRIAAGLAGFVVLIGIWAGGKALLVALGAYTPTTAFARYLLVGLWVGFGAPWVFHRMGLTRPVAPAPSAA